jgi:hypothetical protein
MHGYPLCERVLLTKAVVIGRHGAWAWHSDVDRRCVLNAYWSRGMARQSFVREGSSKL